MGENPLVSTVHLTNPVLGTIIVTTDTVNLDCNRMCNECRNTACLHPEFMRDYYFRLSRTG